MKNNYLQTLLLSILMSMLTVSANALEFTVKNSDGVALTYSADGSNVSVTGADDVEKIVIPSSVSYDGRTYKVVKITSIPSKKNLKTIFIPKSIKAISYTAFHRCENLQKVIVEDIDAWCNIDFGGSTTTNSVSEGTNPLEYAHRLYSDENTEITRIDFPDGKTHIESFVFQGCESIVSVNIPSSVTSIGKSAFNGCTNLRNITIPGSVTTIGTHAFYNCTGLASVDMRYGVATICDYAFDGCNNIQYLNLPNSVTTIGSCSFSGCTSLSSVNIPNSVKSIGVYAFDGCNGIKSLTLGNSLETIGTFAFSSCSEISSVVIPNSVVTIDERAFNGCIGLRSVTIGDGVKTIGNHAFYNCTGITSLVLGKNVETMNAAFTNCTGLQSIHIPGSVTSMSSAFSGCEGLNSIFCDIEDPTNVACGNFSDAVYSKATLYVPEGTMDLYKSAEGWKNFAKIAVVGSGTYTLTYKIGDEVYKTEQLSTGAIITPEEAPEKKNYTFAGWMNMPERMPAEDWEVTAVYIPDFVDDTSNTLSVGNRTAYQGKQVVMPIEMNNTAEITAFQFDLYLPEGFSIAKDVNDRALAELGNRTEANSHELVYRTQSDGAMRFVCTSMSGATFSGNEGTLMNITLDVASDVTEGNHKILLQNVELSDKTGTAHNTMEVTSTVDIKAITPGDVDGTGTVSVNDAVCVINYILGSPAEDFIEPAADLDGNGVITVNDVVILINDYILGGNSQNSLDLAFLQDVTADDDYLYIEEDNLSNMTVGEEREIEVFMNTSRTDIQGLQCDIYLPDGMEFVPEEDGDEKYYADKGGRAAKSHSVAAQLREDGSVRVVETSTSGAKFKDNDQAVFYFTVRATANTAYGQGIRLCNMELSYGGTPINPEDRTFDVKVKAGTVSLNSEGYATFSHASDVEVEGAEVYTATRNGNIISCTKEEQSVAAFNGVILKGEPDATVTLYTNNGVEGYTGNELKPTTTAAGVADIETALVLSGNMFKNYTGAAFDADKAYMPYDGNAGNAIEMVFDGATSVNIIGYENDLLEGAVIKTIEAGKLVIKTANGKYSSVGAKMK